MEEEASSAHHVTALEREDSVGLGFPVRKRVEKPVEEAVVATAGVAAAENETYGDDDDDEGGGGGKEVVGVVEAVVVEDYECKDRGYCDTEEEQDIPSSFQLLLSLLAALEEGDYTKRNRNDDGMKPGVDTHPTLHYAHDD